MDETEEEETEFAMNFSSCEYCGCSGNCGDKDFLQKGNIILFTKFVFFFYSFQLDFSQYTHVHTHIL